MTVSGDYYFGLCKQICHFCKFEIVKHLNEELGYQVSQIGELFLIKQFAVGDD